MKEDSSYLDRVKPLVYDFEVFDEKQGAPIKIFQGSRTLARLGTLPDYVHEAVYRGLTDGVMSAGHYKVVLDKWGRRDARTKEMLETPEMVFYRAAQHAAEGLVQHDDRLNLEDTTRTVFDKMINREMYPNTPYMANAGHQTTSKQMLAALGDGIDPALRNELEQEAAVRQQLFACFVLGIHDSRPSIFQTMFEAAEIQASIGGTGFNFSNLRPANEMIHGTGGTTDGPVAFMAMYSNVLGETMNQGGKREGANMFMLDWNHPDLMRFMYCKREDREIAAANISVATDKPFWDAVKSDGEDRFYRLKNPHYNPQTRPHVPRDYTAEQLGQSMKVASLNKKAKISLILSEDATEVYSPWVPEDLDDSYRVIGRVKDGIVELDAHKVLRHLAYGAWFNGEPGVIDTGHINDANPTHPRHYRAWIAEQKDEEAKALVTQLREANPNATLDAILDEYVYRRDENGVYVNLPRGVGEIRATNPCGEKPLLPDEACVLGHTNLERILVRDENTPSGYKVDKNKFGEDIRILYEILDNAIDQNAFTNPRIEATQKSNRKIGMGFMGLANMLFKLELSYGSEEARTYVNDLLMFWEKESDEASFAKGEKLGALPNFKYSIHRNGRLKRNAIVRTLAPTGTTGFAAQTTGGMEPEFALAYTRTTVQGTVVEMFNPVLEEKLTKYNFFTDEEDRSRFHMYISPKKIGDQWVGGEGRGSIQGFTIQQKEGEDLESFIKRQRNLTRIQEIFVTTNDLSYEQHLRMQAVVQNHVDDAISKTTNFRSNATVVDVENAYKLAHDLGIKGVTFYREGARKDQPLKVKGNTSMGLEGIVGEEKDVKEDFLTQVQQRLARHRPENIGGRTTKQSTPYNVNLFITTGWERNPETDAIISPYEVFIDVGKTDGLDFPAIAAGYGRLASLALKAGVPIEAIVEQLRGIKGDSQVGFGQTSVKSFPDAIALGLQRNLELEGRFRNGRARALEEDSTPQKKPKEKASGNLCPSCSRTLMISEGCEKCSCGFSRCN